MSYKFTKQPYEAFVIAGEFGDVLEDGESLVNPVVTAINKKTLVDTTAIVIADGTVGVSGTQIVAQCRAGADKDTHKITLRTETSLGNKWEVDCFMKVKEI